MSEPGTDPGTELATIERTLRTDRDAYFQDRGMQERYGQLLAERDGGTPAPAKSPHAEEIAQIEKVLRGDRDQYWANTPDAVKRRERYRELLSGTEESDSESWRTAPADARRNFPELITEWGRDFDANWRRAEDVTVSVLAAIEDREIAFDFAMSFEVLPNTIQTAAYREAAMGTPTAVRPADDDEMTTFEKWENGTGAAFIRAWGSEGRRNVGRVWERLSRFEKSMAPADLEQFRAWFKLITPQERGAIIWTLGT